MLTVLRVHLPSDIPIANCELCPYILLRKPDNTITADDIPESNPVDGYYLRCRWFRIQSDKRPAVCSVHPTEIAMLQCLGCLKSKLPVNKSYHCSSQCFANSWKFHKSIHARGMDGEGREGEGGREGGGEKRDSVTSADELLGKFNSTGSSTGIGGIKASGNLLGGNTGSPIPSSANGIMPAGNSNSLGVTVRSSSPYRPNKADANGNANSSSGITAVAGEIIEVGRTKSYTPTPDDVGHVLKLECVAVEAASNLPLTPPSTLITARVIPAPSPMPRRMMSVNAMAGGAGAVAVAKKPSKSGTFTLLSYNVLSDLYATGEQYAYCPPWALSWSYRKQNLMREIAGYKADILCLQEVQSDHYEDFFLPELEKKGYSAVYKKKTAEVYTGTAYAIDGCATFFRKDKFALVKKYEVEFNKAALSLSEALSATSKKAALNRLLKDNVALIVVLEAKDSSLFSSSDEVSSSSSSSSSSLSSKRQLICVANTHIHANPELKDVKIWQVHTLLKGLEKIAASADIPMLVAGDFNSVPGSAPHSLMLLGRVDPSHTDLSMDPLNILKPITKLCHQLPLVSAYSSFMKQEAHRKRMDPSSNEPLFTNCTRDFTGTLDYIFYTADSLTVESLLELPDTDTLRKDTALPSPEWSSDHVALLAEFRYKPRKKEQQQLQR